MIPLALVKLPIFKVRHIKIATALMKNAKYTKLKQIDNFV